MTSYEYFSKTPEEHQKPLSHDRGFFVAVSSHGGRGNFQTVILTPLRNILTFSREQTHLTKRIRFRPNLLNRKGGNKTCNLINSP